MSQPPLVRRLRSPEAWPADDRPDEIELRETHVSWLFFTPRHVYKVKKPVDFGFLDFRTLEDRHTYCQEEVRLNQRLSPDVYLGVVTIREGDDGELHVDGSGRVVEYAVKMRRLPEDRWLVALLERDEADAKLMERIARRIAGFHEEAETSEEITRIGGLETVRFNTRENFQQVRPYVGRTLDAVTRDVVAAYTRTFLEVRRPLFEARAAAGRIRDGHGDLHAGQVCVENGIDFIDCIEFNRRFRYGDVAADLAFLAMDLDHYERSDLARALVAAYVEASGDEELGGVLDFYRCYRATTRGKVTSFLLDDPELEDEEAREVTVRAHSYFELARDYAALPGPVIVVMAGLMGTGKTSLAEALAPRLDADLFHSDRVRKTLAGIDPMERRFEAWGEGIYSAEHTDRTYAELRERAGASLDVGRSVVLDASYRKEAWRTPVRRLAGERGVPFLLVEATASDRRVEHRLATRHDEGARPGTSDGRLELFHLQKERYEPPGELRDTEHVVVDTTGPLGETVVRALEEIYRRALAHQAARGR